MELYMRFPGFRKKALTLSYDDGVDTDIRFIETINKYGIKGTFNLNTGLFSETPRAADNDHYFYHLTKEQAQKLYVEGGHEVAVHTLTHPWLEKLSPVEVAKEIIEDKHNLEEMFGVVVRGMAYPFGTYNDSVVETAEACGIAYSRSVITNGRFLIPTDWLRMPTTCHHEDENLMRYADIFVNQDPKEPWLFYLWGHTYEFRNKNNWYIIENFCEAVGNREADIWYATNIEVYDYVEAFRGLRFSTDNARVYNPAALDVCFDLDGRDYVAKSGCVTELK